MTSIFFKAPRFGFATVFIATSALFCVEVVGCRAVGGVGSGAGPAFGQGLCRDAGVGASVATLARGPSASVGGDFRRRVVRV